jgi:hypothetical protein
VIRTEATFVPAREVRVGDLFVGHGPASATHYSLRAVQIRRVFDSAGREAHVVIGFVPIASRDGKVITNTYEPTTLLPRVCKADELGWIT